MKRKISWLLSVILCLSMIAVTPAQAERAVQLNNTEQEALEILQALDIVSDEYNELSFDKNREISRAEFATFLRRFVGLPETECSALYYNDVSENNYAYNDITLLTESGYLSGDGDKLFHPEEVLKKEHAYWVFLDILGYRTYAANNGVISAVTYSEINKGLSSNSNVTLGDLFMLMYNTLLADCYEMDFSRGRPSYKKSDTSYLYYSRDMIYFKKGVVTGVHGASIYNDKLNNEEMIIDGELLKLDGRDYYDYLGMNVHYIVYFPQKGAENELVWIGKGSKNDFVRLTVDNESEYKAQDNILIYNDNGHDKRYRISDSVTIVYNGAFWTGSIADVLGKDKYELTLISLNNTNDLAIVWSYRNIMVSGMDTINQKVYDKLTNDYCSLNPDDYTSFVLTTAAGEKVDFEDVEDNDIISVYESRNGDYFRGVLSRTVKKGDISGRDDQKIRLSDVEYEFYDRALSDGAGAKSAELYLDHKGYIAYVNYSYISSNRFVAYAYNGYFDEDPTPAVTLKILNENGKLEVLSTGDSVRFNGKKYPADSVINRFGKTGENDAFKPQLVLLSVNDDGIITSVSTASDNGGNNELIKNQEMTGRNEWACEAAAEQNIIGVSMLYDENTKVFNVPADDEVRSARPSKFSVTGVQNNAKYQGAVSYKVTTDEVFYEQYIVNKASVNVSFAEDQPFVQVKKMVDGINDEDDIVKIMTTVSAGAAEREYPVSVDCEFSDICNSGAAVNDISEGDVVRIGVRDGEINNIELIYKHDSTGQFFYGDGGWGLDQFGLIYGECKLRIFSCYVTAKNGSAFKCETGYTGSDKKQQVMNLAKDNSIIVVYDGKHFTKGTYNDINIGDFVIAQTHYNDNIAIAVYKK